MTKVILETESYDSADVDFCSWTLWVPDLQLKVITTQDNDEDGESGSDCRVAPYTRPPSPIEYQNPKNTYGAKVESLDLVHALNRLCRVGAFSSWLYSSNEARDLKHTFETLKWERSNK